MQSTNPCIGGKKAITQLGSLIKALNGLMDFDRMSLGNLMARALAIASSEERSDQPGSVLEGASAVPSCHYLLWRPISHCFSPFILLHRV